MDIISTHDISYLSQYILMERIVPPLDAQHGSTLILEGTIVKDEYCIAELGIFSSFIRLKFHLYDGIVWLGI